MEIEELQKLKTSVNFPLKHWFREANRVADKLASTSHSHDQPQAFNSFDDLPREIRGLITVHRWNMPSFRTSKEKKVRFHLSTTLNMSVCSVCDLLQDVFLEIFHFVYMIDLIRSSSAETVGLL